MKKTINNWFRLFIAIGLVLTLAPGCSKTDDSTEAVADATTSSTESLTAVIDGTPFTATMFASSSGSSFGFGGVKSSKEVMITLPNGYGVGTYAISASGFNTYKIGYYPDLSTNGLTPIQMTSGTITVTSINSTTKAVTGTFTGTNGTISITNGTFCFISF